MRKRHWGRISIWGISCTRDSQCRTSRDCVAGSHARKVCREGRCPGIEYLFRICMYVCMFKLENYDGKDVANVLPNVANVAKPKIEYIYIYIHTHTHTYIIPVFASKSYFSSRREDKLTGFADTRHPRQGLYTQTHTNTHTHMQIYVHTQTHKHTLIYTLLAAGLPRLAQTDR